MLELKNVSKRYVTKGGTVNALDNVSLYLEDKGMVFILGKSGSGKSTLLNVVGGLDRYDSGEIIIKGRSSASFKGSDFDSYRNTFIGFIFQEYNVLEEMSVAKNIGLALELQGRPADKAAVDNILQTVDMPGLGDRKPNTLSGGQKQRVAIARALVKNPEIIMADEPTGALDSNTGKQVFETLRNLSREKLVMVVSHDRDFAEQYGDRIIELADGKIISDVRKTAGGEFIESDIMPVADNVLSIKKGKKLTAGDLDTINEFLSKQQGDLFLTTAAGVTQNVKALSDAKPAAEGTFKDTKNSDLNVKSYNKEDFKLIHSKLPLKHSFKMGASGLKVKPIRLAFTIILAAFSFAFFGLADTIGTFKRPNTATDLIINNDITTAAIQQYRPSEWDASYDRPENMNKSYFQKMEAAFPEMGFALLTSYQNRGINEIDNEGFGGKSVAQITGWAGLTDGFLQKTGFALYKNLGKIPAADYEIAFPLYLAKYYTGKTVQFFGEDSYTPVLSIKIEKPEDFIGIMLDGKYEITGILDTGDLPQAVADLTEHHEIYNYMQNSFLTKLFAKQSFLDKVSVNMKNLNGYLQYFEDSGTNNLVVYDDYLSAFYFNAAKTELASDEVLIPLSYIYQILNNEDVYNQKLNELFYNDKESLDPENSEFLQKVRDDYYSQVLSNELKEFLRDNISQLLPFYKTSTPYEYSNWSGRENKITKGNIKIVGFYQGNDYNQYLCFSEDGYFEITGKSGEKEYEGALGVMPASREDIAAFVKYSYTPDKDGVRLGLVNAEIQSLDSLYSMIKMMSKIFMYIGIGFAVFSSLLMLNFISTSIAHKKREIGILRAIGARSNDVFAIFFNESFIIAAINAALAVILTIVASYFVNDMMRTELSFNANFLFFGIRQLLLIFGISIGTAFIASFLPVKKIASKKPIDSIRNT